MIMILMFIPICPTSIIPCIHMLRYPMFIINIPCALIFSSLTLSSLRYLYHPVIEYAIR